MTNQVILAVIQLVQSLASKTHLSEPEFCCYQKGLSFIENYLEMQNRVIEDQLNEDTDQVTTGS